MECGVLKDYNICYFCNIIVESLLNLLFNYLSRKETESVIINKQGSAFFRHIRL